MSEICFGLGKTQEMFYAINMWKL